MTYRATFTLEPEAMAFLQQVGGKNRSGYINELLKRERKRALANAILQGNREEAGDTAYQEELAAWDTRLEDGLES
ncbi:MAG: hypothetical protein OEU99_15790 [Nitrospira sp.]|nr:hypothetical protein [Nitrospira sp.]